MITAFGRSVILDEQVVGDASGHTSDRMTGRMQVVVRVSGRRAWTVEQKLAILRDAFGPGGSVRATLERHEVSSGLVYTWRRQAMSGELAGTPRPALPVFAEVRVTDDGPVTTPALMSPVLPLSTEPIGRIGIELPSGIKLSVDASVDIDALGRVLSMLAR